MIVRLDDEHLYSWSHLAGPRYFYKSNETGILFSFSIIGEFKPTVQYQKYL